MDYKLQKSYTEELVDRGYPRTVVNKLIGKSMFSRGTISREYIEKQLEKLETTK